MDGATLKELTQKYSQFINIPIYLWGSKTETVEKSTEDKAEDTAVKNDNEDEKATKKVAKTVRDIMDLQPETVHDGKLIVTATLAQDEKGENFYKWTGIAEASTVYYFLSRCTWSFWFIMLLLHLLTPISQVEKL